MVPLAILPLNAVGCAMVLMRILQYIDQYKKLAKKIKEFDQDFYYKRYCDKIFKSPFNSTALLNEIMYPNDIPLNIRSYCDVDFQLTRTKFMSAFRWIAALIFLVVVENIIWR